MFDHTHVGENAAAESPQPHLGQHVGLAADDAAGIDLELDGAAGNLFPFEGDVVQGRIPDGSAGGDAADLDDLGL